MRVRQHRGGFDESMATVVNIEPTSQALLDTINCSGMLLSPVTEVTVEPYQNLDPRNGWVTYIVTLNNHGVYGFTDGPLVD